MPLLFHPTAHVAPGDRLAPGWLKSGWLYLMLVPALVWGWSSLSVGRVSRARTATITYNAMYLSSNRKK